MSLCDTVGGQIIWPSCQISCANWQLRAQEHHTLIARKCARRRRRRAHFRALPVSRSCARICQLAHENWHDVQIIWPLTVFVLLLQKVKNRKMVFGHAWGVQGPQKSRNNVLKTDAPGTRQGLSKNAGKTGNKALVANCWNPEVAKNGRQIANKT